MAVFFYSTGDEPIVEDATGDEFWGCGTDGTGKNALGNILMEVRAELRKRSKAGGSNE